jgi:Kelch motif
MRELDDAALELRLRGVLKEHLGALPLDLTVDALDRRREARGVPRRFGRGRGMTLLAAAALLLVGGALAGSGILRLPSIIPPAPVPSFGLVAPASPETTSPGPSDLAGPSASPLPAAGPGGAWIATGTMGTPRFEHAAVRLLDGRVLVIGGSSDDTNPATAELYDPASGTWSATGNMLKPRYGFPPTLLLDGRVLVGDTDDPRADVPLTGAEVYDPASGTWSSAGMVSTTEEWGGLTATVLRDGNVLVAGQAGAKLYDPDSGTWSATGKMITPRGGHTASCCATARCSRRAGTTVATAQCTRPSCTIRTRGPGPPPRTRIAMVRVA